MSALRPVTRITLADLLRRTDASVEDCESASAATRRLRRGFSGRRSPIARYARRCPVLGGLLPATGGTPPSWSRPGVRRGSAAGCSGCSCGRSGRSRETGATVHLGQLLHLVEDRGVQRLRLSFALFRTALRRRLGHGVCSLIINRRFVPSGRRSRWGACAPKVRADLWRDNRYGRVRDRLERQGASATYDDRPGQVTNSQ